MFTKENEQRRGHSRTRIMFYLIVYQEFLSFVNTKTQLYLTGNGVFILVPNMGPGYAYIIPIPYSNMIKFERFYSCRTKKVLSQVTFQIYIGGNIR